MPSFWLLRFSKWVSIVAFHFSSSFAIGSQSSLNFASLDMFSLSTDLRAWMKFSLKSDHGLPDLHAVRTQSPKIFFGRQSFFILRIFPRYIQVHLVMNLSIDGIFSNHILTCLLVIQHSRTSSIQIPSILLIAEWWNEWSLLQLASDMFQDYWVAQQCRSSISHVVWHLHNQRNVSAFQVGIWLFLSRLLFLCFL